MRVVEQEDNQAAGAACSRDKVPLSVALITKNSAQKLRACLESVSFADEIVVVDSGSTDGTGEIAGEFNARWFVEPWKGYGRRKNSAVVKCSHDWVLSIDSMSGSGRTARKITASSPEPPGRTHTCSGGKTISTAGGSRLRTGGPTTSHG